MRPIVHPPQPAANVYPRFRVDTQPHLDADLTAYGWNTTSSIPTEFFDPPITAFDALRWILLELILNPPPPVRTGRKRKQRVTRSDVAHYAALLRDRIYPTANVPLYHALGRYCSYCEQNLTETIAVEHVAPKSNYPLTSVSWSNFLLGCRSCNSHKDEKPARTVNWMAGATEVARYNTIRGHYLLPDTSAAAYRSLLPVLYANTGAGYQAVDNAVSVDDALVETNRGDAGTKTPQAQVPFTAGAQNAFVRVRLVPTADAVQASGRAQAQASFSMLELDRSGVGSSDDNRMWDRTRTWLKAVRAFRLLANTTDFAGQWASLCDLAESTGFLSTWVRVLELRGGAAAPYPAPPAPATSTLLNQFKQAMTQGAYPNTDVARLP